MLVAVNRLMRAEGQAGPDLLAHPRPRRAGHRRRRGAARRPQPRAGAPGADGDGAARAAGARGARRRRRRLPGAPSAWSLGFALGPRVNAGGRIGAADLGARLLATADPHEAAALAERLDRLNAERSEIEAGVLAAAMAQAAARGADGPLVWAAGDGLAPGRRRHRRGAAQGGLRPAGGGDRLRRRRGQGLGALGRRASTSAPRWRGSTREGLIGRGGGHRMAAGLSARAGPARAGDGPARRRCWPRAGAGADPARRPAARRAGRARRARRWSSPSAIAAAGPYGAGAPAPRLAVSARLAGGRPVGAGHLALALVDRAGGRLDAVAFRAAGDAARRLPRRPRRRRRASRRAARARGVRRAGARQAARRGRGAGVSGGEAGSIRLTAQADV